MINSIYEEQKKLVLARLQTLNPESKILGAFSLKIVESG